MVAASVAVEVLTNSPHLSRVKIGDLTLPPTLIYVSHVPQQWCWSVPTAAKHLQTTHFHLHASKQVWASFPGRLYLANTKHVLCSGLQIFPLYVENVISDILLFSQTNFSLASMLLYSSESTGFLFAHLPQHESSLCLIVKKKKMLPYQQ